MDQRNGHSSNLEAVGFTLAIVAAFDHRSTGSMSEALAQLLFAQHLDKGRSHRVFVWVDGSVEEDRSE